MPFCYEPIIIANIPILSNVEGFVIDGNHRVSQLKLMANESISSYILDEKQTFVCIPYMFQRAFYLYLCDIDDIKKCKISYTNLFGRLNFLKHCLNKIKGL